MKGIELSRAFYEEYGKKMIEEQFGEYQDRIAVGLVGHGSECFGYDDDISADHDFVPGFNIWITEEDEQKFGFKLFRAYSKLPKEFMGHGNTEKSLLGGDERGVQTIEGFYQKYTGCPGTPETWREWLYTPSHYFAEATNGETFADPLGAFTAIREEIKTGMPEDVRLKKIASCALYMAQTGQYNYKRCLSHGEIGAARLALDEFVRKGIEIAFLLERSHMPYYKWAFRAMKDLPVFGRLAPSLEALLLTDPSDTNMIEAGIESYSSQVINALRKQKITSCPSDYLEGHAHSVNNQIKNGEIRNLSVYL